MLNLKHRIMTRYFHFSFTLKLEVVWVKNILDEHQSSNTFVFCFMDFLVYPLMNLFFALNIRCHTVTLYFRVERAKASKMYWRNCLHSEI